jgi:hypothetical protein
LLLLLLLLVLLVLMLLQTKLQLHQLELSSNLLLMLMHLGLSHHQCLLLLLLLLLLLGSLLLALLLCEEQQLLLGGGAQCSNTSHGRVTHAWRHHACNTTTMVQGDLLLLLLQGCLEVMEQLEGSVQLCKLGRGPGAQHVGAGGHQCIQAG